jgi:hypothetical protein
VTPSVARKRDGGPRDPSGDSLKISPGGVIQPSQALGQAFVVLYSTECNNKGHH